VLDFEDLANARLIAAAPALLQELKETNGVLREVMMLAKGDFLNDVQAQYQKNRKAILLATGDDK